MRSRFLFLTIAAVAAYTAPIVNAQRVDTTIAGGKVAKEVRDALETAGTALGMVFHGNADNIAGVEYWGSGMYYAPTPGKQGPPSNVTNYHASIDYAAPPAMRIDYVRDSQRHIEAVSVDSGNVRQKFAWNETEPGGGTVTPALAEGDQRWLQFWTMTPHAIIKAAVDAGESTKVSKARNATVITFPFTTGSCRDPNVFRNAGPCQPETVTFTVSLNPKNLIQRVQTKSNRSSSMPMEITFSDYKDLSESKSGKLFPVRIIHKQGGFTVWDLTITKTDLDYPAILIRTPDSVRAAATKQTAR
jgi:hypothetical protein